MTRVWAVHEVFPTLPTLQDLLSLFSGSLVGFVLGLVDGGSLGRLSMFFALFVIVIGLDVVWKGAAPLLGG